MTNARFGKTEKFQNILLKIKYFAYVVLHFSPWKVQSTNMSSRECPRPITTYIISTLIPATAEKN